MPSQSRAQRRQQNARTTNRAHIKTTRNLQSEDIDQVALEAAEAEVAAEPFGGMVNMSPRTSTRVTRQNRRPAPTRPVVAPADYTADYIGARGDMLKILLWAGLLFAVMIAIKLSGLV